MQKISSRNGTVFIEVGVINEIVSMIGFVTTMNAVLPMIFDVSSKLTGSGYTNVLLFSLFSKSTIAIVISPFAEMTVICAVSELIPVKEANLMSAISSL
jgi:hypothetical protein